MTAYADKAAGVQLVGTFVWNSNTNQWEKATSSAIPSNIATETTLEKLVGFYLPEHDYKEFGYTGANLTSILCKSGGSSGTLVATLTLSYDGSGNITSITKS